MSYSDRQKRGRSTERESSAYLPPNRRNFNNYRPPLPGYNRTDRVDKRQYPEDPRWNSAGDGRRERGYDRESGPAHQDINSRYDQRGYEPKKAKNWHSFESNHENGNESTRARSRSPHTTSNDHGRDIVVGSDVDELDCLDNEQHEAISQTFQIDSTFNVQRENESSTTKTSKDNSLNRGPSSVSRFFSAITSAIGGSDSRTSDVVNQSHSDEHRDLLEANAQSHSEIKHLEGQLKALNDQNLGLKDVEVHLRKELERAIGELHDAQIECKRAGVDRTRLQNLHTELLNTYNTLQDEGLRMESRMTEILQQKGNLSAETKRLRNVVKRQAMGDGLSLDPFNNQVDQVSEAHVKSTGQYSVDSINDAIDNFVITIIEQVSSLSTGAAPCPLSYSASYPELLSCLTQQGLTEEHHGLLLDALLHQVIVNGLYDLFFRGIVSPASCIQSSNVIESMFNELLNNESWTVVQRWRAVTAVALHREVNQCTIDRSVTHLQETVFSILSLAYGLDTSILESLKPSTTADISALHHSASALSLAIKRDILSVRMSITIAPLSSGQPADFDLQYVKSVWPEMGAELGDRVIGTYKFGLTKQTERGEIVSLIYPEVITSALLRETGML